MLSFIDKIKIMMTFQASTGVQRIYDVIRNGVQRRREILHLTGGELELNVGIFTFDFDTYQGKQMSAQPPPPQCGAANDSSQLRTRTTCDP